MTGLKARGERLAWAIQKAVDDSGLLPVPVDIQFYTGHPNRSGHSYAVIHIGSYFDDSRPVVDVYLTTMEVHVPWEPKTERNPKGGGSE
jgi:hypothetical protein